MGKNNSLPLNHSANILIALGSNLGFLGCEPSEQLDRALDALELEGFAIRARSSYYDTPAFPAGADPDFVNAAAVLESEMQPAQILARLHAIEQQMGRVRDSRWGPRTLDLDLIAVGQSVLPDVQTHQYWRELPLEAQKAAIPPELILPHPRLEERAFVLVPLLEVAAEWIHPATNQSVQQMHDALPKALRDEVVRR